MSRRLVVSLIIGAFLIPAMAAEPAKPAPAADALHPKAEEWCAEGTEPTSDKECVTLPVLISAAPPAYPELALKGRISGQVDLEVIVDATGKVVDARIVRSNRVFDEAALSAAKQRTYKPSYLRGKAVSTAFPIVVKFELAPPTGPRQSQKTGAGEIVTVTPFDTKLGMTPQDNPASTRDTQTGGKK